LAQCSVTTEFEAVRDAWDSLVRDFGAASNQRHRAAPSPMPSRTGACDRPAAHQHAGRARQSSRPHRGSFDGSPGRIRDRSSHRPSGALARCRDRQRDHFRRRANDTAGDRGGCTRWLDPRQVPKIRCRSVRGRHVLVRNSCGVRRCPAPIPRRTGRVLYRLVEGMEVRPQPRPPTCRRPSGWSSTAKAARRPYALALGSVAACGTPAEGAASIVQRPRRRSGVSLDPGLVNLVDGLVTLGVVRYGRQRPAQRPRWKRRLPLSGQRAGFDPPKRVRPAMARRARVDVPPPRPESNSRSAAAPAAPGRTAAATQRRPQA
jgi:hypothetical protein